ncbi:MAG TPA: DUF1223 domain-containing protein [Xanthobacteraceae bacterium]|jgi:hypothetical protein|nr:DUF1223 domain-containing protein [Xanthobacteraceae bacterium]
MVRRRLASAPLVAGLLIATFAVARAGEPRALIELFTSQGCSSCPAADKLLGELSADPSVVALSVPIDYWDYLGWKDTLANPAHSARQRAYAHLRGDRQVYTPQVVVNGAAHALGSDRTDIEHAIALTDQKPGVMSLPVLISMGGSGLNVQVDAAKSDHAAGEVWLCPLLKAAQVSIERGENHGRTITYHNVVRDWVKLGDWTGAQMNWNVPISEIEANSADAAAVIVQEGTHDKPGIILGAAYYSLGQQATVDGGLTSQAH